MMYVADIDGHSLFVYDYNKDQIWRIDNKLFGDNQENTNFTIAGQSFTLPGGVIGMALKNDGSPNRKLYFHSLASNYENAVPLSVINNGDAFLINPNAFPDQFAVIGNR